ncbi:hypothetical protein [Methanolapillus millepedarum]|uniref:hypothetical protein n=1 Tax=Methanolapillus millepedarum TaxID=3028296 RepID=UPI0030B8D42E
MSEAEDEDERCVLKLKTGNYSVLGYFTIAVKTVFEGKIYPDQRGDILGGQKNDVTYLIGHLCKNDSYKWKDGGAFMLKRCIEIIKSVHNRVGISLILIECNNEKLVKYYSKHQFKNVGISKNGLYQMIIKFD